MKFWPFGAKPAPAPQPEKKRLASGASSPLLPHADADLIRETLPRVFQRTHKNLKPSGLLPGMTAAHAASLDEAEGRPGLPDVYSVQGNVPGVLFSWFGAHSFIGHQACAILSQHWLIDKACGQAPKDAAQNGFTAMPELPDAEVPPEVQKRINEINQERNILGQCREFSHNARIFGIRHALFLVDGVDYSAPFNPDGVRPGSYRGISQIDPYWLAPEFDGAAIGDPAAMHFYEPTWWRLPGGLRVHRSHFVILRESEVPDVLKPTYYYGGLPLPQQIYERVYAAERTANEAPELAMTKRLITMTGEVDNYVTDELEQTARFNAFNEIRSNFGFLVIGEGENIQQIDTALTDFDSLIMTQYQLVAAIARTPATKLLGTSPKGFNATGEHESDSYDQELVSIQTHGMTPLLNRHHLLLCRSEFSEYPGLAVNVAWNPVRAPGPLEKADLELKAAQAAQTRIAAEITSPDDERARLMADPDGGFAGLDLPEDDGQAALEEILNAAEAAQDPLAAIGLDAGEWNEDDHPRAKDGKFGHGGGKGDKAGKGSEAASPLGPMKTKELLAEAHEQENAKAKAKREAGEVYSQAWMAARGGTAAKKEAAEAALQKHLSGHTAGEGRDKKQAAQQPQTKEADKYAALEQRRVEQAKAFDAKNKEAGQLYKKYEATQEAYITKLSEAKRGEKEAVKKEYEPKMREAFDAWQAANNEATRIFHDLDKELENAWGSATAGRPDWKEFRDAEIRRMISIGGGKGGKAERAKASRMFNLAAGGAAKPKRLKDCTPEELAERLGPEHTGVKGQAAIDRLLREKNGHVKGAFRRVFPTADGNKPIDIAVAWGDDYFGLQHIIKNRTANGDNWKEVLADIGRVIENGMIRKNDQGNYEILHKGKIAIISEEITGQNTTYLLSGFKTTKKLKWLD